MTIPTFPITELNLTAAQHELLEDGLDTFDKLVDYLDTYGSFESINGIGPIFNKALVDEINKVLKEEGFLDEEVVEEPPRRGRPPKKAMEKR